MSQSFWHIRNCSLFGRLSDEQLERLERKSLYRKFPKGSSIYLPQDTADAAFLVAEGRVRLCSTTPDGKQCILGFIDSGELFGEMSVVDSSSREERAEAAVNTSVVLIPGNVLRELMEQSSQLTLGVTKLIGLRRRRIERRLKSLLFRNNRDRLTHLLTELAEQYGTATTEGIELRIRLSHQDLASVIGATRETVTTLLGEMQTEGLVTIRRQKLIVHDIPRLNAQLRRLSPPAGPTSGSRGSLENSIDASSADSISRFHAFGEA